MTDDAPDPRTAARVECRPDTIETICQAAGALYSLTSDIARLLPRDMSMTSVSTLSTLYQHSPQRITALAAAQGVTQPSMTSLIGSLEKSGMVRRRPDPADRRATLIELTDRGFNYIVERRRRGTEQLVAYIATLSGDERQALTNALPTLRTLGQRARAREQ